MNCNLLAEPTFEELYDGLKTWAVRLSERENECDQREALLDGREQSLVRILSATLNHTLTPEQGTE